MRTLKRLNDMEWILISIAISLSYLLFSLRSSGGRNYKAEAMFMEVQAKYGMEFYLSDTYKAYEKFMQSTRTNLFDRKNWVSRPGLNLSIFDGLIKEYESKSIKPTQLLLPQFCETQEYIYEPNKPI